jgi:hypothetical protein
VGGRKKIAGRQWFCYGLVGAVAKQEQQQKQWLHVLLHTSIFEIRIPIKWTDRTGSAIDKMSHSHA